MAATDGRVIGDLVEKVEKKAEAGEAVSIGLVREVAGQRAGGPMLLMPALLVISPLSIIPGLPTLVGLNTILVAGQLALGREQIWLPRWLSERCISGKNARKLLNFLGPVSKAADHVVKPRARPLTGKVMRRAGAVVCVLVGAVMPVLEFVPFTSTWAGVVIGGYALAITARDGLLAAAWTGLVLALLGIAWALLT